MPRTNQDGKELKLVLEWLSRRHITDAELATALDMPPTNYSRRKEASDFPSYEELERFATFFNLSPRALQIAFGLRGRDELSLLDDTGMKQYIEQGGGAAPEPVPLPRWETVAVRVAPEGRRRQRRPDSPPGP